MPPHTTSKRPHPAARMYADEFKAGTLGRREFLTRATSLGLTAAAAYSLGGLTQPARAMTPKMGGTLRVQMTLRALKEPRLYDWTEHSNQTRGVLEHLVEYQNDGSFRGMLLQSWEVSEDAKTYTLFVRPGVTWQNGDAFTAADVARNIEGWCDRSVEGNSMATRMATLVDDATGKAGEGVIEVVDDLTVRLNLPLPDISLIASFADYPSAIVHSSFQNQDYTKNIGTGPYVLEELSLGERATLVRAPDHVWWGTEVYGGPYLDRIEYIDFGTDPAAWVSAMDAEEVDMVHETVGEFIDVMDAIGMERTEVMTASTIVIRPNQKAEVNGQRPYADVRVRRAIQMAVRNDVCLELGASDRGTVAENHHVAPVHPEYAEMPAQKHDPEGARALMEDAGMLDFEHEIHSIDDDWVRNTTDAVAAQMRDAGFKVRRTILPGATFWNDWVNYPFSSTNWAHRPLGVQIYALAYKSGEAWNEFGFENAEFDALLEEALGIADADRRRMLMAKMQKLIQDEGVTLQPYWRKLYRHARPGILGAEQHIAYEHHHYKWGFAA